MFVGRSRELESLRRELERVRVGRGGAPHGRCVIVRGRRRVGKSRLLEEFCARENVPSIVFTASRQGADEVTLFTEEVAQSDLAGRAVLADANPTTWDAALRLLAVAMDDTVPAVVVIDEFPYLAADDPTVEATFQKQWDRVLSKKPVLLVLVGSDIATMTALNTHGRPFFQRGVEMVVPPLSPAETAQIVGAKTAADAFDSYLITGGLPMICDDWPTGMGSRQYLAEALTESTSALIVSAERVLAAEFPTEAQARAVLCQIGHGEMTYTKIGRAAGGLQAASLSRSLEILVGKGIVTRETPLSTATSKEARYRVADSYLRFWLRFIGPGMPEIERGRSDRVIARLERDWPTWRGKAIEPTIREALARLAGTLELPQADVVGGFWTRSNVPEVDIVGADRGPVANSLAYLGTIKWRDDGPLDQSELNRLAADAAQVPGASSTTPLVAVSRSGFTAKGSINLSADDLLSAWPE